MSKIRGILFRSCGVFIAIATFGWFVAGCVRETHPPTPEMKSEARTLISQNVMPDTSDWEFEGTENGVRYVELAPGTGEPAWFGDEVRVEYVLWLADGTLVEESRPSGIGFEFSFTVGEGRVIKGWEEVIREMNEGSEVLAKVPWKLAYGRRGRGEIPRRADLVFAITLVRIDR